VGLAGTWSVGQQSLSFSGSQVASIPAQQMAVSAGGAKWSARSSQRWLVLSTSSTQLTARIGSPAALLVPGTYSANITLSARGMPTKTIPVTLAWQVPPAGPHKLLFSEIGVAFSSTPSWSRLSRTLAIRDEEGGAATWTAASDKSWLTVTPGGATSAGGGTVSFTLQADPSALAADSLEVATVTLTPTSANTTSPEKLVVGLWKGSGTPAQMLKLATPYQALIADPVRPYVYAHNGGSTIDVYNVYLQSQVATIPAVAGALGAMAVAADGSTLYAMDRANGKVALVDLTTRAVAAPLTLAMAASAQSVGMAYARPNGVPMLLLGDFSAYTLAPWQAITSGGGGETSVSALADGTKVVYGGTPTSPSLAIAYSLSMKDGVFQRTAVGTPAWGSAANGKEAALSLDGLRYYTASGWPYACQVLDATNASFIGYLGADAYPNSVKVGTDGRVYCGISGWYSSADVWMYSPAGSLLGSFKFAGYARALLDRQFVVVGDGLVGAALTDDPYLVFIPIGP